MLRRVVVGLLALLVLTTAVGSLSVGGGPTVAADTGQPPIQTTPDGFTNTAFEIRLYENTSAQWTVRHTTPLSNESEREQFEAYAQRFSNQTTETYADFQVRADRLAAFGSNATGRAMSAVGFSRDARVEELGPRGVIELSFRWTNFSRERSSGVVAGDVFQGGMYINSDQRLILARGDGLVFADIDPMPDSLQVEDNITASETVTWFGGDEGRQFADSRPRVVLTDRVATNTGASPTETAGDAPSATTTQTPGTTSGFGPLIVALAVLVLLGLGGAFAWYSGVLPGRDSGSASTTTDTSSAETTQPPPEPAVSEEELLSDEDRVVQLLEDNGGRMKQANIVSEKDWSKSKVSMLLSEMEAEGTISKLRVGRENIISLAGEEPDAAGSPFDDE